MKKSCLMGVFFIFVVQWGLWAQTGGFWGVTSSGLGRGAIFTTDAKGENIDTVYNWIGGNEGAEPRHVRLCLATNGKLYGTTRLGGAHNKGVLFEYDPVTGTYGKKVDFDDSLGSYPQSGVIRASNGKLYGVTSGGGAYGGGVLYEYDPAVGTYRKRVDFEEANKGRKPMGALMQASNGKLYGMTSEGGSHGFGVLFSYDPTTNTFTRLLDFDLNNGGADPRGSLMAASDGKLYGMTRSGGANNKGVLFAYDPATGAYAVKFHFDGANGSYPVGAVIEASNGKLYGMTTWGGANDAGVLFEYDPTADTYTKKWDFGGMNGSHPEGDLMEAANGKLYGLTGQGGAANAGVLFEYDPSAGTFTLKSVFTGSATGTYPLGSLIEITANTSSMSGARPAGTRLFPNPVTGRLHLRMTERPRRVWVETPMGTVLYATSRTEKDMTLDMTGYPPAVYLIRIQTANGVVTYKVIKR